MTLENIYYVGQTIAVVAILASLIGVYYQIRQQTQTARSELYLGVTSGFADTFRSMRSDPEFAQLYRVALNSWESLSGTQKLQVHSFNAEMALSLDAILTMRQQNLIDDSQTTPWVESMIGMLITPGGSVWWEEVQYIFTPLVRDTLIGRLSSQQDLPAPWTQETLYAADDADFEAVTGRKSGEQDLAAP